ncbi:DUF262 domain-containing protein [Pantoea anthophila]|uniref:DUF262 domain-containing protein n=1 Tax=Pantoea anthophila TaxID=470931 RepID=UPI0006150038|nr:DUF262 domain-containing protein [Pantoea anthophila]KKB03522.1 hypothetical protein TN98_17080 [Pantoea anthophila]
MSDLESQILELQKEVAYDSKDYPIEVLVNKYTKDIESDDNEIYVPDYQREFVWSDTRQSRLIESIVLGLPVPPIFLAENKNGRLEIVDGSQRIRTLSSFVSDGLALSGLNKITKLNGMSFKDLDISRKRKFNNTTISVFVLSENATDEVKNDLFERINKGSDILRNMETRKGVYRGEFTSFIYSECAKNEKFQSAIKLSKTVVKRQEHEELILRFFALSDSYPKYSAFGRSLNNALDNYMIIKKNNFSPEEKSKKLAEFNTMTDFVMNNFKYGFAKDNDSDVYRILFEAISVGTILALREKPSLFLREKLDIKYCLTDKHFKKATAGQQRTHSQASLITRIDFIKRRLLELSK